MDAVTMKVLIIIPAYNEAGNIKRVVEELTAMYPQYDYVVVNDGSADETPKICRDNGFNLISLPINLGLSGAFRTGAKFAFRSGYDCALQYDGDGQHDPRFIRSMVEAMEREHADIVIGSRFVNAHKKFTARMAGNSIISAFIRMTTGAVIKDSTSGMRLYSRRILQWFAQYINYDPEPDTIAYLIRCGAKVEEIPVEMRERIAGESYFHIGSIIKYMMRVCSSILFMQWFRQRKQL